MKTLLALRSAGLTDLMGLVIGFVGEHPNCSQSQFREYIEVKTQRPMDTTQTSSLFKTLEGRGYIVSTTNKQPRNVRGHPKKHYTLDYKGISIFKHYPNQPPTDESPVAP